MQMIVPQTTMRGVTVKELCLLLYWISISTFSHYPLNGCIF